MNFEPFRNKMEAAGVKPAAIRAFENNYRLLTENHTGLIGEAELSPLASLPSLEGIARSTPADASLLNQCAVLKLNGGLGTSMGLEKAKSLLEVKQGQSFLDLIALQMDQLEKSVGTKIPLIMMNSFATSEDTRQWIKQHPKLGNPDDVELMQSMAPKVDAKTLAPASYPANPALEWCPSGHGDLYSALAGERIEALLRQGILYLFVSNSDNLGASLDPVLLTWFAGTGAAFAMEVTARTPSDRKGGHLAQRQDRLILRESAQCAPEDSEAFQDIERHRYFNTNNLWLRLDQLKEALDAHGGCLTLPLIRNQKTLDPRDPSSPPVYQLETAMGAAIECFPNSLAIEVPRSRFAPVKTTADLLALRSDAYVIQSDGRPELAPERGGLPPLIKLDSNYQRVDQLEAALAHGVPSLKNCSSLTLQGPMAFASGVEVIGQVTFTAPVGPARQIPAGRYENHVYEL